MRLVGVLIGLLLLGTVQCFVDPISLAVGAGLATGGPYVYSALKNWISKDECLTDKAINGQALQKDFDRRVFGQHLVRKVVLKAVTGFLENSNPKKPLVLIFHGTTGTGKSYVTQILARNIYPKGFENQHVHLFSGPLHFRNESLITHYKAELQSQITAAVSSCQRSIFIFEEADMMDPSLIDAITPFLNHRIQIDGVSYQKAIFIFQSNAGGELIHDLALNFWKDGKKRESIQLKDVEHKLSLHAFNQKNSGFCNSSLINKGLVDFFVPFLPLEKEHVKMCVRAELRDRNKYEDEDIVDEVADAMPYGPGDEMIYSLKGCKCVAAKVDYDWS